MELITSLERAFTEMKRGWGHSGCSAVQEFNTIWSKCFGTQQRKVTFGANAARFHTDFPFVHLRGAGAATVLLVGGNEQSVRAGLAAFARDGWFGRPLPIVVAAISEANVAGAMLPPSPRGVVLSAQQAGSILSSEDPSREFRLEMCRQIPFRRLIPFTTSHPAEASMFFGRHEDLARLLYEDHTEYALWGLGDIGKSSLLRQVAWTLRREGDPRHTRTVDVDLYTCPASVDAAATWIARRICHTSYSDHLTVKELLPFLRRMRQHDLRFSTGPIELLIDEVDEVLYHDRRIGYPLLKVLRHAKCTDLVRLTLSGRLAPREVFHDPANPFRSEMQRIVLGPLSGRAAVQLLVTPLEHLGVVIEDRAAVLDAVLSSCKGHPALIQKWGFEIANAAANSPKRRFSLRDLWEVRRAIAA